MSRTKRLSRVLAAWGTEEPYKEVFDIPIAQLLLSKEEIAQAVSNLSRGLGSMTEGPLEVNLHEDSGRYQLTNGYHRVVETMLSGKYQVRVVNEGPASWRPPTDLFKPDWEEEYFGMEEFIERYELKRL